MKIKIIWFCLCVMLFSFISGCSNPKVKQGAEEIVTAFQQSDVHSVNQIVFGLNDIDVDEKMADIFGVSESNEGILSKIITLDTISIQKISPNEIVYQIEAPDLSKFFDALYDKSNSLSEIELRQYIDDYLEKTAMISNTVSITYKLEDDEFRADYHTDEFINAITGGLLDAYRELYQNILEEYRNDLEGET